ncbi:peptidoglycan-associated lipoprotein Pal [uncultured Gilliamella sp.]|jgi:peptidoglycan-associated lipoprotein|uniref:peptidoglycan-associated lipoprotein Pal n=1 Tax=uncultured Gilliamella sp. TaxID=1193505 RepID=UPI0025EBC7B0|nr:peptidoglycan-associated lipoprotein Pal [uncultured Gilliamella sp.]
MQVSKFIKIAAIALPLIAVTACSTTKSSSTVANNGSLTAAEQQLLQQLQEMSTVYFDYDRYNVKSDYTKLLDAHAEFLRAHSFLKVVIEGHADERGTPEYNIALGERRASAVKSYLQGNGVSANQMAIVSYGKEKPAVLGHNEAAYAKNRRAIITY